MKSGRSFANPPINSSFCSPSSMVVGPPSSPPGTADSLHHHHLQAPRSPDHHIAQHLLQQQVSSLLHDSGISSGHSSSRGSYGGSSSSGGISDRASLGGGGSFSGAIGGPGGLGIPLPPLPPPNGSVSHGYGPPSPPPDSSFSHRNIAANNSNNINLHNDASGGFLPGVFGAGGYPPGALNNSGRSYFSGNYPTNLVGDMSGAGGEGGPQQGFGGSGVGQSVMIGSNNRVIVSGFTGGESARPDLLLHHNHHSRSGSNDFHHYRGGNGSMDAGAVPPPPLPAPRSDFFPAPLPHHAQQSHQLQNSRNRTGSTEAASRTDYLLNHHQRSGSVDTGSPSCNTGRGGDHQRADSRQSIASTTAVIAATGAGGGSVDTRSTGSSSTSSDEVLRESFMVKRSQNRSRFGPTNWRERWFLLTPAHIIYYDGDRQGGRKKEKGRVELASVECVERVDETIFDRQHVFQVVHVIPGEGSCTLYVEAATQHDCTAWLHHIRSLVCDGPQLSSHYHPGRPLRGLWGCCKSSQPCTPITWVPVGTATTSNCGSNANLLTNSPLRQCSVTPTGSPHVSKHHQPHAGSFHNNTSSTPIHSSTRTTPPPVPHGVGGGGGGGLHSPSHTPTHSIHSVHSNTHSGVPTAGPGTPLPQTPSHTNNNLHPFHQNQQLPAPPTPGGGGGGINQQLIALPLTPNHHHTGSNSSSLGPPAGMMLGGANTTSAGGRLSAPHSNGVAGLQTALQNTGLGGNGALTNGVSPTDAAQKRVVRALYDYKAAQSGDLSLVQDEEYEVLEETEEHWWRLRDKHGNEGYSPSNYVKEATDVGLHQYDWYLGDATRQRAETILMREEREGCFVVRNSSSTSGMYTISVYCSLSRPQVKHYHIQKDSEGKYYLSHNIKCNSISELIYKHQYNPGGLCTRLRSAPHGNKPPATAGFSRDKWDIPLAEITLLEEIGSGQFGVVRRGRYRGLDVAVKMMKEGTMSEDEFIEEAKVMTKLQHPNLVQLYGVCKRQRPVYIITEFLEYGSLLHYLRQKEKALSSKTDTLIDMCLQISEGMAYLEKEKFIHRDLAARNCLVGSKNIKVGDFGLARYVVDDEYTGSGGAKFPIKWAAPEVLNYMRFSSKSDVWAFGVLMWEVFTCGKMPYGRRKNADVVAMVQEGAVLDKPRYCPHNVYQVMRECWEPVAEQRPSFNDLKTEIGRLNADD